jgi:hypothetical protein
MLLSARVHGPAPRVVKELDLIESNHGSAEIVAAMYKAGVGMGMPGRS